MLVNSDKKARSANPSVYQGQRKELDVKAVADAPQKGYKYMQKHTVPTLGTTTSGSFSVDNKYDF